MFNFWWSAKWSEWQTLTKTQKSEKRPPMSMKNKMFVYGWRSTFDDQLSDLSNKRWLKCEKTEKGSHVIDKLNVHFWITFNFWWSAEKSEWWASTKMQKNEERPPMSSKNKMLGFGLCSTSDDQLSDLSDKRWLKCGKRPPKSSKNEILIFILYSTSHNQTSDLSDKSWSKCEKITCCFS